MRTIAVGALDDVVDVIALFARDQRRILDVLGDVDVAAKAVLAGVRDAVLDRREKVRAPSGLPLNDVPDPAYQASLWPQQVAVYKDLQGATAYKAVFALPLSGRIGRGRDFVWQRSPFDVAVKTDRRLSDPPPTEAEIREEGAGVHQYREGPGVDYLLAYWLAVYLRVLPS